MIARLAEAARRRDRDEEGFGMVEVIASVFLGAIIFLGVILSFDLALQTNSLATASLGSSSSGEAILSSLQTHMGSAEPLGHCITDPTNSFATPVLQCSGIGTTGSAVAAIGPDGFCFYSPPNNINTPGNAGAKTTTAPSFDCIVVDTAASSPTAGDVYLLSYPPTASATYTTCDPASCWPGISGALLAQCSSSPTLSNCIGTNPKPAPLGTIDLNFPYLNYPYAGGSQHVLNAHCISGSALDGPFQFVTATGQCLAAESNPPTVALVQATIAVQDQVNHHDYLLRSSVAVNGP